MGEMDRQKESAFKVVRTLQASGFTAFFAGGCVRDQLLGRSPRDYDVATDAKPDAIEALFPKTLAIGKAFGVIVVVDGKETTDVATFRGELGTHDGRHPATIHFCGAEEDAQRRDFTINGMFYDPIANTLHDFVNGRRDLNEKRITAIGNPDERFQEDHLRMLRAIRFTHTLGFTLDPATADAIRRTAHRIVRISAERIEMELARTLTESARPGDALRQFHELGLLEHILPELIPMIGQEQPPQFHPEGDVFEHTVLMLNLMNAKLQVKQACQPAASDGQTGKSTPQVQQTETSAYAAEGPPGAANQKVERTFQSAHAAEEPVEAANQQQTQQASQPASNGQTGKSTPQVQQTEASAQLTKNPFRPIELSPSLHTPHRRLPHWNQDSRIYFITFRLADSIAQEKQKQWKEELELWREKQPTPNSPETIGEKTRCLRKKQQEWLDQGHGACILKEPIIQDIVEQTLHHFDGNRYYLGDYVIMPNHLHVIVEPIQGDSLSKILQSWKGYSARAINQTLDRKGTVWMDESFDHIIRHELAYSKFRNYIHENPRKAWLVAGNYRLGNGTLQLNHAADGQTGKSTPQVQQTEASAHAAEGPPGAANQKVERTFQSAHAAEEPAVTANQQQTQQASQPASNGQTGKSTPQVQQTEASAHAAEGPPEAANQQQIQQASQPASDGQTGKSTPQVQQTKASAYAAEGPPGAANQKVERTFQSAHAAEEPAEAAVPQEEPTYTPRELAYALLLHDVGKPPTARIGPGRDGEPRVRFDNHASVGAEMAEKILTRLKLPNKERQRIVEAIRGHMRFMEVQNMRVAKLRNLIGADTFGLEMKLHQLDCLGSHGLLDNYDFLTRYQEKLAEEPALPEPWLRGHDLIALGFKEGQLIGKILKEAYDAQMESQFTDRDALLDWVRQTYCSD